MAFRGPCLAALPAVLWLAVARPALARPSPQEATLRKAIHLVARLEDERARALLQRLLRRSPPAPIAAQCHLYLGIIALNALDSEGARAEFKQAIATDATVELPISASPKARLVFGQAQAEVAQTSHLPAAPEPPPASVVVVPPAPPAPPPEAAAPSAPQVAVQAEPRPAIHVPAYVVGGVAVAALAGGIAFGVEANSTLAAAKANPVAAAAEAQGSQVGTYGLFADVCYGVALVGAVTAVVLFFTEKPRATDESAGPTAGVTPVPGGAVVTAGSRF